MEWQWRGDYFPVTRSEYETIKAQVEYESKYLVFQPRSLILPSSI